jgi:hypothetical protein
MKTDIQVIIKDQERKTLKNDFEIHGEFKWSQDEPILQECVNNFLKEFHGEPEDIILKATMIWK